MDTITEAIYNGNCNEKETGTSTSRDETQITFLDDKKNYKKVKTFSQRVAQKRVHEWNVVQTTSLLHYTKAPILSK